MSNTFLKLNTPHHHIVICFEWMSFSWGGINLFTTNVNSLIFPIITNLSQTINVFLCSVKRASLWYYKCQLEHLCWISYHFYGVQLRKSSIAQLKVGLTSWSKKSTPFNSIIIPQIKYLIEVYDRGIRFSFREWVIPLWPPVHWNVNGWWFWDTYRRKALQQCWMHEWGLNNVSDVRRISTSTSFFFIGSSYISGCILHSLTPQTILELTSSLVVPGTMCSP